MVRPCGAIAATDAPLYADVVRMTTARLDSDAVHGGEVPGGSGGELMGRIVI
jgi:hypothetical protein